MLNENEVIVVSMFQKDEKDKNVFTTKIETKTMYDLIPSEHPEKFTFLQELEKKIQVLNKLLDNNNLKPGDKKKLEQLKNLYFQQKNILIENKTEDAKIEVQKQYNIDVNKYIEEEKQKRKKVMEEMQKKIEEEIAKKPDKAKKEKSIDSTEIKDKIFRNQKMYTGTDPWRDPLFEPKKESLCPFNEKGWLLPKDNIPKDIEGWDEFEWDRSEEIFDPGYSIIDEEISIDEIIQGKICDCYFLSVLGSLCRYPELIEKIFYSKEKTKEHL
jgi:hypothetical protein